jgi:hypothetical protein
MDLPLLGPAIAAAQEALGGGKRGGRRGPRPSGATRENIRKHKGAYQQAAKRAAAGAAAGQEAAGAAAQLARALEGDVDVEVGIVTDRAGNILGIGVRTPNVPAVARKAAAALKRATGHLLKAEQQVGRVQAIRAGEEAPKAPRKRKPKAAATEAPKAPRKRKPKAAATEAPKAPRKRKPKAVPVGDFERNNAESKRKAAARRKAATEAPKAPRKRKPKATGAAAGGGVAVGGPTRTRNGRYMQRYRRPDGTEYTRFVSAPGNG